MLTPKVAIHLASMCLLVSVQFTALSTRVGTQFTLVWFLPCVTAPVYNQVAAVFENLSTELTGLFSCSNHLPPVLGVKEGPNLSLLDKGLHGTGLHRGQASGQEEWCLDLGLGDGGRAPEMRSNGGSHHVLLLLLLTEAQDRFLIGLDAAGDPVLAEVLGCLDHLHA